MSRFPTISWILPTPPPLKKKKKKRKKGNEKIERILNLVDIVSVKEKFFSWLPFAAPVFTQNVLVHQMREVRLVLR